MAAIEKTIKHVVEKIKQQLAENQANAVVTLHLKKTGVYALTLFEGQKPKWSKEYDKLFALE